MMHSCFIAVWLCVFVIWREREKENDGAIWAWLKPETWTFEPWSGAKWPPSPHTVAGLHGDHWIFNHVQINHSHHLKVARNLSYFILRPLFSLPRSPSLQFYRFLFYLFRPVFSLWLLSYFPLYLPSAVKSVLFFLSDVQQNTSTSYTPINRSLPLIAVLIRLRLFGVWGYTRRSCFLLVACQGVVYWSWAEAIRSVSEPSDCKMH